MNDREHPPRLFVAFFRWFCHPECREDIEGDLRERFHKHSAKRGVRKAQWLFAKDVLLLFRPGIIRSMKSQVQLKFIPMKRSDWIKFAVINLLFIVAIISPFLPGPPNPLVIGLSVLGQSAGFFGLLLVPIGITWAIVEIRKLRKKDNTGTNRKLPYMLAITATVIITAISLLLLIAVFHDIGHLTVGLLAVFLGMILGAFALKRAITAIRKLNSGSNRKLNPMPLYLLAIPLIALITRMYLVEPVSSYSRNFAIQRSQSLIASIEDYKNKEGKYPESIQELEAGYIQEVPSPFIMGILNYRYNQINEHYSLSFSQWLELGSLEEIVLYDKNNLKNNLSGPYAKYDYSFDLYRVKGAFASSNTGYDHWRFYRID